MKLTRSARNVAATWKTFRLKTSGFCSPIIQLILDPPNNNPQNNNPQNNNPQNNNPQNTNPQNNNPQNNNPKNNNQRIKELQSKGPKKLPKKLKKL
jgi:hypothetical protein